MRLSRSRTFAACLSISVATPMFFGASAPAGARDADVVINEIRIDQPSGDFDEYFELKGAADTSLDGLTYLVLGDSSSGVGGVIEAVVDLNGHIIGVGGYFVVAEESFTLGVADYTTYLNFENGDNVTHLLVQDFTGFDGDDLDTDDDGVLDVTPWTAVIDAIGLVETVGTGEAYYGAVLGFEDIGPDGEYVPSYVYRCESASTWIIGVFDPTPPEGEDTPGLINLLCDADDDGVGDDYDNCPEVWNPEQLDCDDDGMGDACAIADGYSEDCNENGVPDECDLADLTSLDCNENGIPDECDVADLTSLDCNENGVPDECDLEDLTSLDCNENGIPDECDIADLTSLDCNENGIPDECDLEDLTSLDCNENGVPDECDIADLTSLDCNENGVPDECDVADLTSLDCNENGVPDECDVADLTSLDCNENGIPDECDIADGTSEDCNENGVPDDCDIADGTSEDLDENGIPDECQVYCEAFSEYCDDEYIERVELGDIDNSSDCEFYSDYTDLSTEIPVGIAEELTVTNGNTSYEADQCGVWVDWNQDYDFDDPGEMIAVEGTPGVGPYTAAIYPPTDAVLGDTRLRIRLMEIGVVEPCGTPPEAPYGEVEDYTIIVVEGLDCPADITGPYDLPDGVVDVIDLLLILGEWGKIESIADITGPDGEPDGMVDVIDLLLVLGEWGDC